MTERLSRAIAYLRGKLHGRGIFAAYMGFFALYFAWVWHRGFTWDEKNNFIAGNVNLWGDGAMHFTLGSAMAFRDLIPETSPLLLGAPFKYPILSSLVSALLIRAGVPFHLAFTVPSFFLCLVGVAALFVFYRRTLGGGERRALLACAVFLFNGGMGILYSLYDAFRAPSTFTALVFPPGWSTFMGNRFIQWISVIHSMFIPQRSFQIGLPAGLAVLLIVHRAVFERRRDPAGWAALVAGALLGLMPIIHAHTALALSVPLAVWCAWDFACCRREGTLAPWIDFWGRIATVALPFGLLLAYMFILRGGGGPAISWYPGWFAKQYNINWLWFWFLNWGITPLLALAGLGIVVRARDTSAARWGEIVFYAPFLLIFVLGNLFLFQAWVWDNTKMLVWASLGMSALAARCVDALLASPHEERL